MILSLFHTGTKNEEMISLFTGRKDEEMINLFHRHKEWSDMKNEMIYHFHRYKDWYGKNRIFPFTSLWLNRPEFSYLYITTLVIDNVTTTMCVGIGLKCMYLNSCISYLFHIRVCSAYEKFKINHKINKTHYSVLK